MIYDLSAKFPYVESGKRFVTILFTEKIFWGKSTDNVPDYKFFIDYLDRNTKQNTPISTTKTPNYLSQTNATFVVDSDIYNFSAVYDTKKKEMTFYIVKSFSRKWQNGYEMELVLDIWTTYGLDFFKYLINNYNEIKVERYSKLPNNFGQLYLVPDQLLNDAPTYFDRSGIVVEQIPLSIDNRMFGDFGDMEIMTAGFYNVTYTNKYAVFQSNRNKMILIPVLNDWTNDVNVHLKRFPITEKVNVSNNMSEIQKIISNNSQNFKGIFIGPCISKLEDQECSTGILPLNTPGTSTFLYWYMDPATGTQLNFSFKMKADSIMFEYSLTMKTYYNLELDCNAYVYFLQNMYAFNSDNSLRTFLSWKNNEIIFNSFDGVLFFANGLNVTTSSLGNCPPNILNENSLITFSNQLPVMIDEYQAYINANKNSLNTSLNTLRQNRLFNNVTNYMSGSMNVGSGILGSLGKGDVVGAATGAMTNIMNMVFSFAQNELSYSQSFNAIRSAYADKKTSSANQLMDSSTNDIQKSLMISTYVKHTPGEAEQAINYGWNQKLFMDYVTHSTLQNWNRLVFLYGFNYNGFIHSALITPLQFYNYVKIADDFITTNFSQIGYQLNYTSDILALVSQMFSDGIRICKVVPDYETNFEHQVQG